MEKLMLKKKISVLEHAFASSVGAYYSVNLTKNKVPGVMYQIIDDKEYSINEQIGMSENADFSEVVWYWGKKLSKREQKSYFDFFKCSNLLKRYEAGERHVYHRYWTQNALFEPMLAEQHIIMFEDEENGDILGITYVIDLTQQFRENEYKRKLEEKQKKLEFALQKAEQAKKYQELQVCISIIDEILRNLSLLDGITSMAELNQLMPKLLASLGRYSMSDRAYVFSWASIERQALRMTHEWCAQGVRPTINEMQHILMSEMPNWTPKLNRGEAIVCDDWDAEKKNTPQEYALFDGQDIHSLIVIPIFSNRKLNGYIGFDNPEQSKSALSLRLLSAVGGHIGGLQENLYMMEKLENKQKSLENSIDELNKEKQILDVLSIDYTSVYYCDLLEDTMIPLKQYDETNAVAAEKSITSNLQSFSFRIQYYFDHFVVKESAPDFVNKLSADYLIEYLGHHERFGYRFRSYPNPAGQQNFEVQIVRLKETSGFKVVMGFRYIDDIIAEQENQKAKLENALETATLNSEIIDSISKIYWLIYRMDLGKGTYEEISAGQEMHKLTGKRGYTNEVFGEACETIVSSEYQEKMKEFLDTSTLSARLQDTESIAMEYRAVSGSWHLARFIVKKRDQSGKVLNVLYVVRQIDKEKQAEIQYKQSLIKNNRILSGLSLDYTTAFVINLDTDDYEFVFNQKTNHAKILKNITKFEDYVDKYARDYVLPKCQEAMKRELNSNSMKKRFKTEHDYHFSFETVPNAAGLSCFQAHIVKQYEGENHFAFLGFRSVDDIIKQERFYKNAIQKANQALQQELNMITNALPGGVKISNDDKSYSFKYVSKQFANMLGYETPEELMEASGGTIVGLAHPDDLETGIADALEQYTKSDQYVTTYRMKCKDGSWKYIEDRGHKFQTSDGDIEHWNLILDKNELVEKTIALESEKKANQSKSDFLSRMSHDMRTPLNGIIGLLDICKKHPDDRELVDSSRWKARIAADHLLSLINDTLELSKLENKDVSIVEEIFHVPTLIREVETIAQMRADEDGITISYKGDIDHLKYSYLMGSPLHIKQILLNLITNGIKYNQNNGFVYYSLVEKDISETKVALEFTIQDTGIGMSQSFMKDIFKPFVQADQGARSTYMGTGLGMAIVKNLLDRMNGTIQIDSTEGKGTIINVVLPLKIANKAAFEERPQEKQKVKHKDIRVLLAEDNELNREIAAFVLKDEGIKVTKAINGKEAVSIFLKNREYYFDAILMDIMMPEMDGYQATYAIRNCDKKDSKTIPIIAMTANAFDDDRQKTKAAGMNAHLSKPLDAKKMIETIENFCDKNRW